MTTKKTKKQRPTLDVIDVVNAVPAAPHLKALGPIPAAAYDDPVAWADKELDASIPEAVREKQWQLKFGSDTQRDKVASELLARRNVVNKQQAQQSPPGVIHLHMSENPFAKRVTQVTVTDTKQLPADASDSVTAHAHKTENDQ